MTETRERQPLAARARRWSFHVCSPWSGDCAMRHVRFNIATPWGFLAIGLFGAGFQRRGPDGRYTNEWISWHPW